MDHAKEKMMQVITNIERVVVGKRKEIELSLIALFSGGHVLLEDVPGVGKTMLVRALARSLGASFKRIQFTPDLLPSDVTGISIYNEQTRQFEYRPGPIFTNILLADEINRTSPKTQSALLEALEEGSVTVDGKTRSLEQPFFVMATQNPIEFAGTYALPEAQLDRFLLKIELGYPTAEEEVHILHRHERTHPLHSLQPVMSTDEIIDIQQKVRTVFVSDEVKNYIVSIAQKTRAHPDVYVGVSPRGTIALMKVAQAAALGNGRDYVTPDDVLFVVSYVLNHRIILTPESELTGRTAAEVIEDIIQSVSIPIGTKRSVRL